MKQPQYCIHLMDFIIICFFAGAHYDLFVQYLAPATTLHYIPETFNIVIKKKWNFACVGKRRTRCGHSPREQFLCEA